MYFAGAWVVVAATVECPGTPDTKVPVGFNIVSIMRVVLRLVEDTVAREPVAVFLAGHLGEGTESFSAHESEFAFI